MLPPAAREPTLRELSEQIGAIGAHLQVVHEEASLARHAAEHAGNAVDELRRVVDGDHAPRITRVEARASDVEQQVSTVSPQLRACALRIGAYGGAASLYPLLDWLIPLVQRWLTSR